MVQKAKKTEERVVNRKMKYLLPLILLALAMATPGCGVVNNLRAKNSLNEGVREFNKGKYQNAEEKFAYALDLSPGLTNAQLFYARALNAQFDQNLTDELGKKTIGAYDQIIAKNPDNYDAMDQSLAFKANIYNQLTRITPDKSAEYTALQRETLEKRANLASASAKTKADVYYTLGVGFWKESYDLNASYVSHNRSVPPDILEKMKPLDLKAHEYLQKAISVDPNYANAWFYEKLVYIEDMKREPNRKDELTKKAFEMQDKFTAMQKAQQQQAASDAAAAPTK
jgi:tetratricopeptide (TPR) repeat protein